MSKKPCCSPETPVHQAVRALNENGKGALLVVENDKPVGILTDHQLVSHSINAGIEGLNRRVSEIMCGEVQTIGLNYGFSDLLNALKRSEVDFVAVVDEQGHAVDAVSYRDLIELLGQELAQVGEEPRKGSSDAGPVLSEAA